MNSTNLGQLVTPLGGSMRRAPSPVSSSLTARHMARAIPQGGLSRFAQGGMAEISHDDLMHMHPQTVVPDYLMQRFDGGGAVNRFAGAKMLGKSVAPFLGLPMQALATTGMMAKDAIRDRPDVGSIRDLFRGAMDPSRDALRGGYSNDDDDQFMSESAPHSGYTLARRIGAHLNPAKLGEDILGIPADPISYIRGLLRRQSQEREMERQSMSVMDDPAAMAPMMMGPSQIAPRRYACGGLSMFRGR